LPDLISGQDIIIYSLYVYYYYIYVCIFINTIIIPSAIRRVVADREFLASSESGIPSGKIRVMEDGQVWGYSPFLARSGADEGDILIVEFDLTANTAILQLGDNEIQEKLNPC
jgi:hypothetical protein